MLKRFFMLALSTLFIASPAGAQTNEFYKGKTLEILVGFSPGGGYDAYARALGAVIGRHIAGQPNVVVRNMTGAGSLRLALFLADAAPRDGTTIGIFDNGLLIAPLLKPETAKFDASKLSWVGSVGKDTQVCMIWHETGIASLNDLKNREVNIGVTGTDDIRYMSTAMMKNVAGAKLKIVPGYPGSTDIRLAIERRELDGVCDSWQSLKSTKAEWVQDNKVNLLVQMAAKPHPNMQKVPTIMEFAAPNMKTALDLLVSPGESGRSFVGPPGVPADRLEILRRAFDASMKDKEFLDTTAKSRLDVEPMPGEEIEKFLNRIYKASPEDVATARKLIQ